jgi:hypothetical protein
MNDWLDKIPKKAKKRFKASKKSTITSLISYMPGNMILPPFL